MDQPHLIELIAPGELFEATNLAISQQAAKFVF
jgi:hypothetical protein